MYTDLILGTAGHIDHGKTSLVKALTGVDTDRLPEEKQRGITIEPGFASLQIDSFRLGIVDVPGHERFIRQMLSGATGMDMVMLVVAANESIKPQTVEHYEILRLLDLPSGIVVITKSDLVDDQWLAMVEEEIRQLVADSFLASAPIVRASAVSGEGLPRLKQELLKLAQQVVSRQTQYREQAPFRMPIDRSFSLAGHGAIVTGSVATGQVAVGATLAIEPGGHSVRVRSLQNYDEQVTSVHRGQRAAINLVGVDHHQIERGQEIATPDHLVASRTMAVSLHLLSSAPRPLKDRARIRFHVGTSELSANIRLLGKSSIEGGESSFALAYLSDPSVATNQQPFVIRAESPAATIGGGRVLIPNADRRTATAEWDLEMFRDLAGTDESKRLAASIYFEPIGEWKISSAPRLAAVIDPEPLIEKLKSDGTIVQLSVSPSQSALVHSRIIQQVADRIKSALAYLHKENPLRMGFPIAVVEQRFDYLPFRSVFDAAIRLLKGQNAIEIRPGQIALAGLGPELSKAERQLLEEMVERIRTAGLQPPDVKQLRESAPKHKDRVSNLLDLAVESGDLHSLGSDIFVHSQTLEEIQGRVRKAFGPGQGFTVSQMRELLATTRKYAVPLAEYLDKLGFTRRENDLRFVIAQSTAAKPASNVNV